MCYVSTELEKENTDKGFNWNIYNLLNWNKCEKNSARTKLRELKRISR